MKRYSWLLLIGVLLFIYNAFEQYSSGDFPRMILALMASLSLAFVFLKLSKS